MKKQDNNENGPILPEPILRELRGLARENKVEIPASFDRAILKSAQKHLSGSDNTIRFPVWGIAAGIAIMISLAMLMKQMNTVSNSGELTIAREDLDGNGRVDIVDAFILASWLRDDPGCLALEYDFNGDGTVNRADADYIASKAVRIDEGREQA